MSSTPTILATLASPREIHDIGPVLSAVRLPDKPSYSPGFLVLCRRSDTTDETRAYSTHIAYTHDGGEKWIATTGKYDMSFPHATSDLLERVTSEFAGLL